MKGEKVPGYKQEKSVSPDSNVDTFAAVKFYIDNWRWQDVPFYVSEREKRMNQKDDHHYHPVPPRPQFLPFRPEAAETWRSNRLTFSIQPEMDIRLRFQAKHPGQFMTLNPVDMVFSYEDAYDGHEPEAYETLLLDVMGGNATLFYEGRPQVGGGLEDHHASSSKPGKPAHAGGLPELFAGFLGPRGFRRTLIARDEATIGSPSLPPHEQLPQKQQQPAPPRQSQPLRRQATREEYSKRKEKKA